MFDVGFWEVLFILVLALVVIGPERLPGAARQAGLFVGKARRYIEGVRSEVESELDISEFKRILSNQEVQINELQNKIRTSVDNVVKIDDDLGRASDDDVIDTSSPSLSDSSTDPSSKKRLSSDEDDVLADDKKPIK